ncbi:GDSL family lipase [Streptomyces lunaelactis]|nr:GDSL family lipase [Streptomyces lunaelactis]NUK23870.1 GDSL family lipase [Streptomyces lunaelactis]NUK33107.1 GDSL family lipase [Streptomyces lunaelactis]NUK40338.1 GDSL family lipase [Streptomyces lunaelactis]NUK56415.1 GDSL family lipase [Streptomyces lunaelactis]
MFLQVTAEVSDVVHHGHFVVPVAWCRAPRRQSSSRTPRRLPVTWLDPGPFLRGVAWLDNGRAVRADPADLARLPWDTAERAELPIGVRLEFTARGADAVEIRYRAAVPGPTDALRDLAHCFALWEGGHCVSETFTEPAEEAVVTISLPGSCQGPFTIYPPEGQSPVIVGLRALGGSLAPAALQPRWLVHGDSITEGWWSTRPAHSWPAVAGRALGLDTVNLGHAGAARGELPTAQQLAALPADVITLAFGTNCWTGIPCSAPLLYETTRAFIALVRQGHPDTPLLLVSPVLRPDAEQTPNPLGATLAELRTAMEKAVRDRMRDGAGGGSGQEVGDKRLALLPGRDLIGPDQLADGVHPNDEGHAALAAAVAGALRPALSSIRPSGA